MSGSGWGDLPDDDEPGEEAVRREPVYLDLKMLQPQSKAGKRAQKGKNGKPKKPKEAEPKKPQIPKPPSREIVPLTGDEIKRGISERSRAAANLKVEGYSYADIADLLEFRNAQDAKRAVESVLAAIHGPGDYETLRLIATARAEDNFKRSSSMARAHFIETEDGERLPNVDQKWWHAQSTTDLMTWVNITGAKAPTKLEITPGDEDVERLVQLLAERSGHEDIIDADVIEFDEIPQGPEDDDDEV